MNQPIELQLRRFFLWAFIGAGFSCLLFFYPSLFTDEQVQTIHQFGFDDPDSAFRAFRYSTYISFILCGLSGIGQVWFARHGGIARYAQRSVDWLLVSSGLFSGYSVVSLSIEYFMENTLNFAQWIGFGSMIFLLTLQTLLIISEMLVACATLQDPGIPLLKKKLRPAFGLMAMLISGLGIYGFYLEWRSVLF